MKVNLYYFSGTGNSLFIAKTIQEGIVEEHCHVTGARNDLDTSVAILPIQKFANGEAINDQSDWVGIIYPTYFLDAPDVVKHFAKRLQIRKGCYLFLYSSYGETLGNALHNMNQLFEHGQVRGNYEVVLPDNSIIFESKKDEIPKMLEAGEAIIRAHAKEIYHQKITPQSPYSLQYHLAANVMKPFARRGLGFKKLKVNKEKCNHCGLCEKLCPMRNISMEESLSLLKTPVFGDICESCFSCLHYCPQEAITYQRMSRKKTGFQYRHPQIRVKEMIDAQQE
jgi:ferredoxin